METYEYQLLEAMKAILGSCVTTDALKSPSTMMADDILVNIHLYERLGTAFVMVGKIRGYKGLPKDIEQLKE